MLQSPDAPSTFGLVDLDPTIENEARRRITTDLDQSLDELMADPAYGFKLDYITQPHEGRAALTQAQPVPPITRSPSGSDGSWSSFGSPSVIPSPPLMEQLPADTVAQPPVREAQPRVPPKVGTRFSKEVDRILKDWVVEHRDLPFPRGEERERLQRLTGLTKKQVLDWMANYRRRGGWKARVSGSTSSKSSTGQIDVHRRNRPAPMERPRLGNPMERRVESRPEDGSITATAVADADDEASSSRMSNRSHPSEVLRDADLLGSYSPDGTHHDPIPMAHLQPVVPATNSMGRRQSVSHPEARDSVPTPQTHRSRRTDHATVPDERMQTTTAAKGPITFHCTFCRATFQKKHRWQRHEETIHLSVHSWTCAPDGPIIIDAAGLSRCVFCRESSPSEAHIAEHHFDDCQKRRVEDRTFDRKDHIKQHLGRVHLVTPERLACDLDQWKTSITEFWSQCGFCGSVLETWPARADHLADHFKVGWTMDDWRGGWGFEESVLSRVKGLT